MRMLILSELVYKFKAITINFPHGALKELYIHTLYFTWRQGTERIPSEVLWAFPGSARWPLGTGQEGWEPCEVSEPHQIRWGALCKLDQGTGRREASRDTRTGRGGDWQGLPTAEITPVAQESGSWAAKYREIARALVPRSPVPLEGKAWSTLKRCEASGELNQIKGARTCKGEPQTRKLFIIYSSNKDSSSTDWRGVLRTPTS